MELDWRLITRVCSRRCSGNTTLVTANVLSLLFCFVLFRLLVTMSNSACVAYFSRISGEPL